MNKEYTRETNDVKALRENKRTAIRKIHVNLPEEVHKKLRVKCALEDITIQDYVAQLIASDTKEILFKKIASK